MEHLTLELARRRGAELRYEAARYHLGRVATCCRPSTWVRRLRRHGGLAPAV